MNIDPRYLGDDLTSAALLLNPSGAAAPIDTLTLQGMRIALAPNYIMQHVGAKDLRDRIAADVDTLGLVSFCEADSPPVLRLSVILSQSPQPTYHGHYVQTIAYPITYRRTEDDTAAGRNAAANEYFHRLSLFSNLSDLSGSMMISFVNLLKCYSAFGVSLWRARVSGTIGSWTVPLPRYISCRDCPKEILDSTNPDVIFVDPAGEKLLGYSVEYVKAYILAIEGLFAANVAAQAAAHYLATNAAARELPLDLLKADFYDKVNYIHNIDDLISSPINVNVNDKTTGAPLKDFQASIPERIPDPRSDVPTGVAGKTGDGFYYPRARIKQLYENAMTVAGDNLIAQARNLKATGRADINLLTGYSYPTSFGIALAKVDIPKISGRTPTEDVLRKYGAIATIAIYVGMYMANKG